jgi:hypothetical protein
VHAYEIVETDLSHGGTGRPTARADVAFGRARQTHEMMSGLEARRQGTASGDQVRSPGGIATAGLRTAVAGFVAAAPFAATGYLLRVPGWLTLTLAMLTFLLIVVGTGYLIVTEEIRQRAARRAIGTAKIQPQVEG